MAVNTGMVGAFYIAKQNALSITGGKQIVISDATGGELDFASDASFSIEMWVVPSSDTAANGELIAKGPNIGESDAGWMLRIAAGNAKFVVQDSDANSDVVTSVADVANSDRGPIEQEGVAVAPVPIRPTASVVIAVDHAGHVARRQ